jgi:hypothetical protein
MPYKDPARQRAYQREYGRRWHEANREARKPRLAANKRVRRDAIKAFLIERKSVPCADCGKSYPHYVMDFDHLRDKVINIARAAVKDWSLKRLQAEIDKCEVVCSNCHRERTHRRGE